MRYQIDRVIGADRTKAAGLIGETGGPRWKKWVIGQGNIVKPLLEDGVFSVIAPPNHDGYLELLPGLLQSKESLA